MPDGLGVDAVAGLRDACPDTQIVLLTMERDIGLARRPDPRLPRQLQAGEVGDVHVGVDDHGPIVHRHIGVVAVKPIGVLQCAVGRYVVVTDGVTAVTERR